MPSTMQKYPITITGFVEIEAELKRLKRTDRPAVIQAIAEARAHGDLSENAEYHAAREKQSFIEGRIMELEGRIAGAQVIDPAELSGDTIKFGAVVTIVDEDTEDESTYQIVGEYEADLEAGKISNTSPLARALIGRAVGDNVTVDTPGGEKDYEVLRVEYS